MAPARPVASRNTSSRSVRSDDTDELEVQQAGRSATALAAAASAYSLRQQAQRSSSSQNLRSSRSTPNLLKKKKTRPQFQLQDIGDVSDTELGEPLSAPAPAGSDVSRPGTSAYPQESFLSVPTGSNESGGSSRRTSGIASVESSPETRPVHALLPAQASSHIPIPPIPTDEAPPLRRPITARMEMSKRDSQLSLARLGTPRSVRDLGADYDRYYNPFASRNNSQLDLAKIEASSQLTLPTLGSAADLQRHSNPFRDSRRYSSAWQSNVSTRPTSPLHQDPEKGPIFGVTAFSSGDLSDTKPGTPNLMRDADPEKTPFYPYVDDRLGNPEYAFPLFVDTKEEDDDLHMPAWDDDIRLKPKLKDHFTRENICSTLGMILMLAGLLCVFVVLPIISYTGTSLIPYGYNTPLDEIPTAFQGVDPNSWYYVNSKTYPLLGNVRQGLIDPDTPSTAMSRTAIDGTPMKLVFSDEFNVQNRTFYPGDDAYFYGFDGWYGATQDLEWYDPDALNTGGGVLEIGLDKFLSHGLGYRSGMLHSWNQLCFKGGVFEVSVSLPGPAGVHGWWPGVWTMGNLGRPGYLATTDGLWPYTYDECDAGITPNQSMTDGTSRLPGQRLNKCTCDREDHPNPGHGRGAPEIDVIEVSADWAGRGVGVATQSFQAAPFDIWYYPNYDFMETPNYNLSFVNTYTGGPFQQAVSTTTMLNNSWYDGKAYQKYAFEYQPGRDENAYVQWYVGEEEMMKFDARALGPNGNVGQRIIAEEPMSIVMNLGFSHSWVDIDLAKLVFPTFMRIDYVRWYQKDGAEMVTCDPPGFPTTQYIADHPAAYNNYNYTLWSETGYAWPQNTLMNGCKQNSSEVR